jgi:outer membrane lipoprotein-sorting protein
MSKKISNPHFFTVTIIFLFVVMLKSNLSAAQNMTTDVKDYIKNIKSIAVEFTQTDSTGVQASGMLIIDKPYKFRCNYYEPFPLLIVGGSNYVSVYDYEMEHLSRIKAEDNIFYFLLVSDIDFQNKFEILAQKVAGNNYVFRIKSSAVDKISEITFDKKTKNIKKMQIYENSNIVTIDFNTIYKISNASSDLFILKDPDIFGKPEQMKREDLEKRFNKIEFSY